MKGKIWPAYKKILIGLTVLVGFVLSSTQLWDWFHKPSQQLRLVLKTSLLALPPPLFELFADMQEAIKLTRLEELEVVKRYLADANDARLASEVKDVVREVSYYLAKEIPSNLPYDIAGLKAVWMANVSNPGTKRIEDVVVTLPHAKCLTVSREGSDAEHKESSEVIRLGTMRPKEEITLIAWTNMSLGKHEVDRVKVTHADGVGKIYYYDDAGPVGRWLESNLWFSVFATLWIGGILVLPMGVQYHMSRTNKDESDQSQTESVDAPAEGD